jgi:hypothetical protein
MFFWGFHCSFCRSGLVRIGEFFSKYQQRKPVRGERGKQHGKEGNNITTSFVALSPCKHVKRTCECSKTPDRNQTRPLPQSPQTSPRAKNLISFLISIIFVGKKGFLNLEFCDSLLLSLALGSPKSTFRDFWSKRLTPKSQSTHTFTSIRYIGKRRQSIGGKTGSAAV